MPMTDKEPRVRYDLKKGVYLLNFSFSLEREISDDGIFVIERQGGVPGFIRHGPISTKDIDQFVSSRNMLLLRDIEVPPHEMKRLYPHLMRL